MIKKFLAVSAAALVAGLSYLSCPVSANAEDDVTDSYSYVFYVFGTEATLAVFDNFATQESQDKVIALKDEIGELLISIESKFSTSVKGSDIYNFNAAQPGARVEIDKDTYTVLGMALDMYEETDGAYNAGVYYSVDLYGFATRTDDTVLPYDREDDSKKLPDKKYVTAFRELSEAFPEIKLEYSDGRYYAVKPEKTVTVEGDSTVYSLKIDLGGIGKGYTVDIIDKMLDEAGYANSYFNFGASSWTINGSPASEDGTWELGFRDPRGTRSDNYLTLRLKNSSVSTSGNYEKYYEIGGKRYCHIINPATGSPIQTGISTATCIGGSAAENDARTTAICSMSLEEAIEYINSDAVKGQGIKAGFVYENWFGWRTFYTNMDEGEYVLTLKNSLPSWMYLIIVFAVIAIICAAWFGIKKIRNKKSNSVAAHSENASEENSDAVSGEEK